MKKRLAMIVTMLMVTVSMAACGGKKDTTADKESVINTEATEEVAETEEPETEAVAEQETTGKLESNTSSAENTAAQPSDNNTSKSNKSNSNSGNKASAGSTASAGTTTSNAGGTTGSSNSNTNASNNNATPAHVHTWVLHEGSGHYETQVVKEAWDEPVYETQMRAICNQCGADLTNADIDKHFKDSGYSCGGYHAEYIQVQTGTVHHDAETKQVYVQDVAPYAQCSGCGEIGPVGSGISIN